ncbi:MAG: hypothetical protein HY318_10750 [Armatimonadetes bacterium]|nr:hypothetical protein [Armatimonadota bacterium]
MELLLLIIAGLALAWSMLLQSRVKAIETIMDSMGGTLRHVTAAVGVLDQRLKALSDTVTLMEMRQSGVLRFKPETKLRVALATHPRVAEVLQNHSIDTQALPDKDALQNLSELASDRKADLDELLSELNALLDDLKPEDLKQEGIIALE